MALLSWLPCCSEGQGHHSTKPLKSFLFFKKCHFTSWLQNACPFQYTPGMAALSDGCETGLCKCKLKTDLSLFLPHVKNRLSLSVHLLKDGGAQVNHSVQEPLDGSWGWQDQKEAVMCGVVTALTFALGDSYNGRIWQHAAVLLSPIC